MEFEENRLYYSHQQLHQPSGSNGVTTTNNGEDGDEDVVNNHNRIDNNYDDSSSSLPVESMRRHFREFFRNYRLGNQRYIYRDRLLKMHRKLTLLSNKNNNRVNSNDDTTNATTNATNNNVNATNNTNNTTALMVIVANNAVIHVDVAHVAEYDPTLCGYILNHPAETIPVIEKAASDALQSLLYDENATKSNNNNNNTNETTANDDTTMNNNDQQDGNLTNNNNNNKENNMVLLNGLQIQVLLNGNIKHTPLRNIKSEHMNKLLSCPGIVTSTSPVKNRTIQLKVRCPKCNDVKFIKSENGPFGNVIFPQKCNGGPDCKSYPFTPVPDDSIFIDQQTLKLQEAPEKVPTGEMPRSVLLAVERNLVDVAPPGTRVVVMCIPTLFTQASNNNNNKEPTKSVYLRVVGMIKDNDAHGQAVTFTPAEEEAFCTLAKHPNIYNILSRSIAPNISGSYTISIKQALTCQLFGGSRKHLHDGIKLRGDINILLLGDPSMAKSQFLKFISKVAPVGIYTSGKGSSAAGLTASVVRDQKGEFYLEGGAMVLADGGIVCIDEFDKMRPNDRVAIHEAMEQQTISVAKAGITTVLNSRSSVLAAANPVYGRYDDLKSAGDNIDLMTTILSRFDMIFLVRDIREEERDRAICQHVMGVHIENSNNNNNNTSNDNTFRSNFNTADENNFDDTSADASSPEVIAENAMCVATTGQGELDVATFKKYIQYCKAKCFPRLSEDAGEVLTSAYVKIRDDVRKHAISQSNESNETTQAVIPITVRQLEALVRISESLAKMRMDSEVRSEDVTEALRLFKVSTMAANAADQNNTNTNNLATAPNREEMERVESFLRARLTIGNIVNKQKLIEEAAGQGYNALLVARALSVMTSRGELLERNQGRLLKRIK